MRIRCSKCKALFGIQDSLVTARGVKAQCPACGEILVLRLGDADKEKTEQVAVSGNGAARQSAPRCNRCGQELQGQRDAQGLCIRCQELSAEKLRVPVPRQWRIKKEDGTINGPLTLAEVQKKVQEGEVGTGDRVARGAGEFKLISSFPDFSVFSWRPGQGCGMIVSRPPASKLRLFVVVASGLLLAALGIGLWLFWWQQRPVLEKKGNEIDGILEVFSQQVVSPIGSAAEAVANGRKLMLRDTRISYLQADHAFKTAMLLDRNNLEALAGWIQNRALLDAGSADMKERKTALEVIDFAMQRFPEQGIVHRAKAFLLYSLGDIEGARASANQALEKLKDDPESQLILGASFLDSNTELAVRLFRQALQANPNVALAYHMLGEAHIRWGKFGQALRFFQGRLEKDPGQYEAMEASGRLFLEVGEFAKAKENYELILGADPNKVEAAVTLARLNTQIFLQPAETVKLVSRMLGAESGWSRLERAQILAEKSVALRMLGETREAVLEAKRAVAEDPAVAPALYAEAAAEHESGQFPSALAHLGAIRAQRPNSARLLARIAEVESQLLKFEEALKDFAQASEIDPRDVDIQLMLASLYLFLGDPIQAFGWLRKVGAIYPFLDEQYRALDSFFDGPGILRGTVERSTQSAEKYATDPASSAMLGIALFRTGKLEKARAALLSALKQDGDFLLGNMYMGVLALAENRPRDAVPFLEKAHRSDRLHAVVTKLLALAYLRGGRKDKAQALFQAALKAEPGDLEARLGLAEVLVEEEKRDEALGLVLKVFEADRQNLRAKQLLFRLNY